MLMWTLWNFRLTTLAVHDGMQVLHHKSPAECADNDGHNTDAIDALTLTVPIILRHAHAPTAELHARVCEQVHSPSGVCGVGVLLRPPWVLWLMCE